MDIVFLSVLFLALSMLKNTLLPFLRGFFRSKWKGKNKEGNGEDSGRIYNLDHAVLNLPLPRSMWMNMGYWRDDHSTLEEASKALLEQVLITARLIPDPEDQTTTKINAEQNHATPKRLIDVGFGCGDQSMYLTRLCRSGDQGKEPLVSTYVGMTIVPSQANFARHRMDVLRQQEEQSKEKAVRTPTIHLFCADAANPASWDPDLQSVLTPSPLSPLNEKDNNGDERDEIETYLLALDTLYHFKPSRTPLLTHATSPSSSTSLHASTLLAFDLFLADQTTLLQRLILRAICAISETPYTNFLTRTEYIDMLVDAGYASDKIVLRDVSENVFGGIVRFIEKKDRELARFGLGVGKFRGAKRVFGWWARTGVVRGVIVVARR